MNAKRIRQLAKMELGWSRTSEHIKSMKSETINLRTLQQQNAQVQIVQIYSLVSQSNLQRLTVYSFQALPSYQIHWNFSYYIGGVCYNQPCSKLTYVGLSSGLSHARKICTHIHYTISPEIYRGIRILLMNLSVKPTLP